MATTTIDRAVHSQRYMDLANKTVQVVQELFLAGQIAPEVLVVCRNKVTLAGPKSRKLQTEFFNKNSWRRVLPGIAGALTATGEYKNAISLFAEPLVDQGGGEQVAGFYLLQQFIERVASAQLEAPNTIENAIQSEVELFVKEVFQEPVSYIGIVELSGLIIETEPIEVVNEDFYFVVRQVYAEDLETERSLDMLVYSPNNHWNSTESILEIHRDTLAPRSVQDAKEKAVALLRLYDVGSVHSIKTHYNSDSYNMMAKSVCIDSPTMRGTQEYTLTDGDRDNFCQFWEAIYSILPSNFYDNITQPDFLSIAYSRYSESLMAGGGIDRKLASAVMGLESLLSVNESEIRYKLQKRTAKLFWALGFKALDVNDLINETYNIRSKYVHGEHFSSSKMQTVISKISGVEDQNDLLKNTQNLLRICIVFFILRSGELKPLKIKDLKDELVSLLDKALIDASSDAELIQIVGQTRSLISPGVVAEPIASNL